MEPISTTAMTSFISGIFKEKILSGLQYFKDDFNFLFDNGLLRYCEVQYNKFITTKTFFYSTDKVPFYKIFFPVSINHRNVKIKGDKATDEILFKHHASVLIGAAGSGKTMMMKHLFITLANEPKRMPLILYLRDLNEHDGSLEEYINKEILKNVLKAGDKYLTNLLEKGSFYFLLDGYDEIYSDKLQKITSDIDKFIDKYHENYFIITSRPGTNLENQQRYETYFVEGLVNGEIKQFVHQQLSIFESQERLERRIIDTIDKAELSENYKAYFSSPLLLTMFISTYENYPEVPKTSNRFYWNVFQTLCSRHDSITKGGGYQHERTSGLSNEEIENVLQWLAYRTLMKGIINYDSRILIDELADIRTKLNYKYEIDALIKDLTVSIGILIEDGLEYRFPHKSMQEYFAALLISKLPEATKIHIYQNVFPKISFRFNEVKNFWNLCKELDPFIFLKYFELFHLGGFMKSLIDSEGNFDKFKKFSEVFAITYYFNIQNDRVVKNPSFTFGNSFTLGFLHGLEGIEMTSSFHIEFIVAENERSLFKINSGDWFMIEGENISYEQYGLIFERSDFENYINFIIGGIEKRLNIISAEVRQEEIKQNNLLDLG